jgi:hypothetical protein
MFGPCRAPGIELAGQALNKNAVALMPKNQWRLVQLTDCRRLPGAKSGDSNSYIFGQARNGPLCSQLRKPIVPASGSLLRARSTDF